MTDWPCKVAVDPIPAYGPSDALPATGAKTRRGLLSIQCGFTQGVMTCPTIPVLPCSN
ncbi:hypothetical protein EMIT0P258_180031 [Pseudomonas sp. IT-P258]